MPEVRKVGNHLLGVVAGTGNNVLTVDKIAAAAKAKGSRGKALAFGKLAGDAALGRLTHGQVRLSDFKGSLAIIQKRLARQGCLVWLAKCHTGCTGLRFRSERLQAPYRCEVIHKGGRQLSQASYQEI
jgi:hypothetical protein